MSKDLETSEVKDEEKDKKKKNKVGDIIQNIIIAILIVIILALLLQRCNSNKESDDSNACHCNQMSTENNTTSSTLKLDDNAVDSGSLTQGNTTITSSNYNKFNGYGHVVITSSQPNLELKNDKFNESYAKYIIYSGDTKIYETDLIAPGKSVNWNVLDTLKEKGTYKLKQACSFYDISFSSEDGSIISQIKSGTDVNNDALEITIE